MNPVELTHGPLHSSVSTPSPWPAPLLRAEGYRFHGRRAVVVPGLLLIPRIRKKSGVIIRPHAVNRLRFLKLAGLSRSSLINTLLLEEDLQVSRDVIHGILGHGESSLRRRKTEEHRAWVTVYLPLLRISFPFFSFQSKAKI